MKLIPPAVEAPTGPLPGANATTVPVTVADTGGSLGVGAPWRVFPPCAGRTVGARCVIGADIIVGVINDNAGPRREDNSLAICSLVPPPAIGGWRQVQTPDWLMKSSLEPSLALPAMEVDIHRGVRSAAEELTWLPGLIR